MTDQPATIKLPRKKLKNRPKYVKGQRYKFPGNPQVYVAINSGTLVKEGKQ